MARKIYDLAVKTGTYQSQGETKNRYMNVGALMESDDGNSFIMLNACFNPAGVPRKDGSESILVSCFVPKDSGQQQQDREQQRAQTRQSMQQAAPRKADDFEEDIPF
jgi:hypothetical protein